MANYAGNVPALYASAIISIGIAVCAYVGSSEFRKS